MNSVSPQSRHLTLVALLVAALLGWLTGPAHGQIYVDQDGSGSVSEYNANTGAVIANGLITGLNTPSGLALAGVKLFVATDTGSAGAISSYNAASGAEIQANLVVTGQNGPSAVALTGNTLFVANESAGTVGAFNAATGAPINANLVTGLSGPSGLALSGNSLYVSNFSSNSVGLYNAATGAAINAAFITGLHGPIRLALYGNTLFVVNGSTASVGAYNATTGATINANFITGFYSPSGVAVLGDTLYVVDNGAGSVGLYNAATGAAINANLITGLTQPNSVVVLPTYTLGASSLLEGPSAGNDSILLAVSTSVAAWTAVANNSWLHITPGSAGGAGNATVQFSVDANPGATRTGTVTIGGQTLTVIQAGSTYVPAGVVTTLISSGLSDPQQLAVDSAGNVYVADTLNNAIKQWTPATGTSNTFLSGLDQPAGVAVDGSGNLYITEVDSGNYSLQMYTAATQSVTALIPGSAGLLYAPYGVGLDRTGNIYIANSYGDTILEWVTATQTLNTLLTSNQGFPTGVAVDALGNVYFADYSNSAVGEYVPATQAVTAPVSTGLLYPDGVATDGSGNVYIADYGNNAIKEYSPTTGAVDTLVASGLNLPSDVALDSLGNIYIVDQGNGALKELPRAFVDPTPRSENPESGSDALPMVLPATENLLPPFAPTSDQPWLTIGSVSGGVINYSYTANTLSTPRTAHITVLGQSIAINQGAFSLAVSSLAEGPSSGADSVVLTAPSPGDAWTAVANNTWLHISAGSASGSGSANVIFTFDANTGATRTGTLTIAGQTLTITQAGSTYVATSDLTMLASSGLASTIFGLAVDGSGNIYFGAPAFNGGATLYEYTAATQHVTFLATVTSGNPFFFMGVAVDGLGNVYVVDRNDSVIYEYNAANQSLTAIISSGLSFPTGVAVDSSGNVYIADTGDRAIKEFSAATQTLSTLVSSGLSNPTGVAVDAAGNVYIADNVSNSIYEYTAATQSLTTLASGGSLYSVAVDDSGNVYFNDNSSSFAINEYIAATQAVITPISSAADQVLAVAVDSRGDLYLGGGTAAYFIQEQPRAFVDPTAKAEAAAAATDALPAVLPPTTSLLPPFAPSSDQGWLGIGSISGGVIDFNVAANTAVASRSANISVLGQTIPVTQTGSAFATFNAPTDIPFTASSFESTGGLLNVTLNFTPSPGTNLTVIQNTGTTFLGTFSNVPNGSAFNLTYNGTTYPFIAWYYGGASGRDLVLLWPNTGLAAWGQNDNGQLGDDTTTQHDTPSPVDQTGLLTGKTVVQIARGASHTLALTSDGLVYAWGANASGQLGNNDATGATQYAPVAVDAGNGGSALFGKFVVAVAAGQKHSLALCSDGTVAAWGDNAAGELGNNDYSRVQQNAPVAVSVTSGVSALFGKMVTAISAGQLHNLALCSDGTVVSWGDNTSGELGNNDGTGREQAAPVVVSTSAGTSSLSGKTVVSVAAGSTYSLALCADGTVSAWGFNGLGELGNNDGTGTAQIAPVAVNTASGTSALFGQTVTAIAAGSTHALALCADGTVAAWGANNDGQLGNDDHTGANQFAPVLINTAQGTSALFGKTVTALAAGASHSVALCADGTLAAWGNNTYGELGNNDGSGAGQLAPVAVDMTSGQSVLSAGPVNALSGGSQASDSGVIYAGVPPLLPPNASASGPNASAVTVGGFPNAVAINPITNKAYVLAPFPELDNNLEVINLATGAPPTTINLQSAATVLDINSLTNQIYVGFSEGAIQVIDGSTDNPGATLNVGGFLIAINPVTNTIYTADASSVTVINGASFTVTTTLSGINSPVALAVNPATNTIYVASTNGTVTVINGSTNATSTITLPGGTVPVAIAVNAAANIIYIANGGPSPGNVIPINGANNAVLSPITVGNAPTALAVDPRSNQAYVVNAGDNTVSILFQLGAAIVADPPIAVGAQPTGIAFNPSNQLVYVTNTGSNSVSVLDGATRAFVETVAVGEGVSAIAVNPITNEVLATNTMDGTIALLDRPEFQSAVSLNVNGSFVSAAVNPITNQIYVSEYSAATANGAPGSVVAIDGASGGVSTILTGYYASAMAVNPVTNKIYLANVLSFGQPSGITVIDGATNTAQTITAPIVPYPASSASIAVNPVTNQIYIANGFGSSVTVIDGASDAATTFEAGSIPYAIAVNPVTNMIYVANAGDNTVTILNGATNATSSVSVGTTPVAVAVNPVTNQIYVANQNSANITVIDGASNLTSSVNVGNAPQTLAVNSLTNTIYVGNAADHSVTIIQGGSNATTVLGLPTLPGAGSFSMSLVLDSADNLVYVADAAEGTLTAIDGATTASTVLYSNETTTSASGGLVVNPATHNVYFGSVTGGVAGVTVINPANSPATDANTLLTAIAALPNNLLPSGTAAIALSAASTYAPNATSVQQIYYQLDSIAGAWTPASAAGATGSAPLTGIPPGLHTLYAFAADGQEAPSSLGASGDNCGNSPIPGAIAAYSFLSSPGAFSFTNGNATAHGTDLSVALTVQRNFSTPATVSYQTVDDTAVAGTNYVAAHGVLSFAAGQTQQMITVPLLNPTGTASQSSFLVQLSDPTGYNVVASPSAARVLILNNSGGANSDASLSMPTVTPSSAPPAANASINVTLTYDQGTGNGQWRLFGELQWRDSGTTASGLIGGNYEVEFKPINSYQAPALQVVPLPASQTMTITAEYTSTGAPAVGSLSVTLTPNVGGWRRQGSTAWHPSGYVEPNLNTGSYILEFQPVTGFVTPEDVEVMVQSGDTSTVGIVYLIPYSTAGAVPMLVQDPSNSANRPPSYPGPYAFAGQIQTDVGLGTGFVPLDRIVVTAAHVIFDDVTLSYVTGVRWFFQEELGAFEQPPQVPTGFYVLDGYAAQRAIDNTPDISSPASQQLDVAVLYFMEPTARGGQSGYLAGNNPTNSWLTGTANKLILGYPSTGIDPSTVGDLYATPPNTAAFTNDSGSLFSTTAITSYAGNSGGPLCVQHTNPATAVTAYYPAAIYLGGTDETVVRAIDSQVIDLMTSGETSGSGGANHVGGGVIVVNAGITGNLTFALGSLTVNIQPAEVVAQSLGTKAAFWEISDLVHRFSGAAAEGLAPGSYQISFPQSVANYNTPSSIMATVQAGGNTNVTGVYTPNSPPAITSAPAATADPAQLFTYQIKASLEPTRFAATGLPSGLNLNPATGVISGIPAASGAYNVKLSATNIVGTGNAATMVINVPLPGQLNVTTTGSGTVAKAFRGATIQPVGSSLSILATPAKGYLFGNWTDLDSSEVVSTQPRYTNPAMPLVLNLEANFVQNPYTAGAYVGLLQGGSFAESGYMRLSLLSTGSFTAVFHLGQASTTLKSAFSLPADLSNPVQLSGAIALPDGRNFDLVLTLNGSAITGTLSAGGSSLNFSATRPVTAPVPSTVASLAGSYSAAFLLPTPSASLPAGSGAASLKVTKTGAIHLAGALGDGVKISASGALDATGSYPFYFYTAGTKAAGPEIALGQISAIPGKSPVQFTSTLDWSRNADANDPLYPSGFFTRLELTADPSHPLTLLGSTAHITFAGGALGATPFVQSLDISTKGLVTPTPTNGSFSLSYSAATGLFTGIFLDNGAKRNFTGTLLQSQTEGFGFFQEANGVTGSVLLQAGP